MPIARDLAALGFSITASRGTAAFLRAHGIDAEVVYKVNEGRPNIADQIVNGKIDLVIAPFAKDTPWATMRALSPPVRTEGKGDHAVEWRAAMRTGENRWITMVEINARQVAGQAGA